MKKEISPKLDKNSRDKETKRDRKEVRQITTMQQSHDTNLRRTGQGSTEAARRKSRRGK